MSAGCYARQNGFECRVFERRSAPGGVAAVWQRGDYLIDGGIHFIMGHKPGTALHAVFKTLGIADPSLYTDMLTYGRFIHQPSGVDLLVGRSLDGLAARLKQLAPEDAAVILELVSGASAMRGRDLSMVGMSLPPELSGPFDQLGDWWQLRSLMKYLGGRFGREIRDFVKDVKTPWLRDFFCSLFTPESPAWFIMMMLAQVADGQCAFLVNGCLDFARALEKRYTGLGGEAEYDVTVEQILVEKGRAAGVRLADGREFRADYVISTGDSSNAIFHLLGGRYVNDAINERHQTWPLCRPFLTASFGVACDLSKEAPFSTIVLDKPINIGGSQIRSLFLRILNYGQAFAPAGKTLVQVEIETSFDYWIDLQSGDRAAYDREKRRLAAEFLNVLDTILPGLSSRVEVADVATPYTMWRYTLNRGGAWGGWLMDSRSIKARIRRTLPGLEHFYLAGQWVMCGGVAPSLLSGRHAVQLLCRAEKMKFSAETS